MRGMRSLAVNLNGISIAYLLGLTNAVLAVVAAFGVGLNATQRVAIVGLVNAVLILAVHLAHRVGEATASGQAQQVATAKLTEATDKAMPG